MMGSTYITSDLYHHDDMSLGMEMDMEVKSEMNSEDEISASSSSETSQSFVLSQNDDFDTLEDEPLVEIESITVSQELVKDELEPSLLLFVNNDYLKNGSNKNSSSSNNSSSTSAQLKSISEAEEQELSIRKSITKALRNVKRIHNNLADGSKQYSINNTSNSNVQFINQDNQNGIAKSLYTSSDEVHYPEPATVSPCKRLNKLGNKVGLSQKQKGKFRKNIKNKNAKVSRQDNFYHPVTDDILYTSSTINNELLVTQGNEEVFGAQKKKTAVTVIKKKRTIIKDRSENTIAKPDSFDCTVCGKQFREKSHLATHSRAHINIRNFKCNECGSLFKTKTNLFYHMKTHEEAPFDCKKCNKTFPERKMLMRHIRVVHSSEGQFNCDQCGRSFKSAQNLTLHYTIHTGNKPYSCNTCGKTFVYKSTYTSHMKAHEADDTFNCELCPTGLPSDKGELRRRCNHHSEAKPWLCTVCGKGYPLKCTLKNHMKTHEPEKPFKCNQCGKAFMKKQSYECHMKVHAGESPQYMCDQCSQSYFNVFALKRHYLKHTSERRFVCDICKKAFWMKDALKVHRRSHSSLKLFHCTQCTKSFAHKHTLVAHMRTHSSEPVLSCSVCPKTFIHKCNLDRHEQHHLMPPLPSQTSLPLPPSLIMMAPPKHLDMPTLHIL